MKLPRWLAGKESAYYEEIQGPSLGWEDPLEEEMEPTAVFLSGKFHEQRNLVGFSPWGSRRVGHH